MTSHVIASPRSVWAWQSPYRRLKIFLILFLCFSSPIFACTVTDDTGATLSLKQPATRIVSLAPDITEILFALHADKNIVGVMQGSDYPANKIPIVANYISINQEAILLLHPDLIIAWDVSEAKEKLNFFKQFHIPIYYTHPTHITDVAHTIKNFGCLVGKEKLAENISENYLQRYQKLKNKFSHRKNKTVFYEVWSKPLMTINKDSWINQAITLCGGTNIFANVKGAAPVINPEAVIDANPDVIISQDDNWQKWPQLKAVKNKHVYHLHADLLDRAGPRLINGVEQLCEFLS